eukprot:COSAG03_NODE_282_length_9474_cov_2.398720_7_plen_595_part_00
MRVVSWNVGEKGLVGLAAARDGGLRAVFAELGNPAIIALQETKLAGPEKLTGELANVAGYTSFFSYCTAATGVSLVRTGYAGTGTYVRHDVNTLAAAASLGAALTGASAQHTEPEAERLSAHLLKLVVENDVDSEGRAVLTDHGSFVLVNVYCPAFGREDQGGRAGFKKRFHEALTARCEALLRRGRQVLLVGDLNVTALPIDVHPVHRGRAQLPQAEYQQEQPKLRKADLGPGELDDDDEEEKEWSKREWFHSQPFVDCFRAAWPTRQGAYTFWPTVSRARETNTGSRLDYILASAGLSSAVTRCDIQPDIMGSDHCPIYVELRPTAAAGDPPAALSEAALSALELPRLESLPALCSIHLKRLRSQQTDLARYWQKADATRVVGVAAADSSGLGPRMAAKRPSDSAPVGSAKSRRRKAQDQRGSMEAFLTVRRTGTDASYMARDRNGVLDEDAALKEAIRRSLADTCGANASMTGECPPARPESTATPAPGAREAPGKTGGGRTGLGGAWDSVFNSGTTRIAPRCYHNEPAASYETKDKRSEHFGRRFWACDDKQHPKGDWHCNPFPDNNARCPFFLWSQSHRGFVARGLDGK